MKTLNYSIIACVVILLGSCSGISKFVYDNGDPNMRIRHFADQNPDSRSKRTKYYVRVDSSNIQFYYSFFPDKISKTSKIYGKTHRQFVFGESLSQYRLTQMDSAVLRTTDHIIDTLQRKDKKKSTGVKGLVDALDK